MPAAYDFVLDGVFSHIENGRVYFVVPAAEERVGEFDNQTVFHLSEVYWNRIGCPVMYTRHRNVGEQ